MYLVQKHMGRMFLLQHQLLATFCSYKKWWNTQNNNLMRCSRCFLYMQWVIIHFTCVGKCSEGRQSGYFSLHIQGKLTAPVLQPHSPLSVYDVAFALHCPDPATPKGNWFLPLCCPFTSLSSSLVSSPILVSSHLFSPSAHSSPFHTHTPMSSSFFVLHFARSFAPLTPRGSLVMPACFIALYSISKPPASLLSSLLFPHTICFQLHPSSTVTPFSLFPPCSLSSVYTLHLFNHLIVSFQSLFTVCLSLSSSISYYLPSLYVCASAAKCYPFLLFSVCLCVSGPVLSPQIGWQMDYLSKDTYKTISRPLYVSSYSYFKAVIFAAAGVETPPWLSHIWMGFTVIF